MHGIPMGGSYNCRVCGGYHNSAKICHKTSRQRAQISIERLELVIQMISLNVKERQGVEATLKTIRDFARIPTEKIYNRANATDETIEQKNIFPELKYNPIPKSNSLMIEFFDSIVIEIEAHGRMTVNDYELFKMAIKNAKKELIK